VHKGQGQRPLLDARGLRALRRHCITYRHDCVNDITKWALEYFQKPLSVNTCHLQMLTKALSCKKEAMFYREYNTTIDQSESRTGTNRFIKRYK